MFPLKMVYDIKMEFVQALNPLYAVPILAVIVCALIVYAFGFKSPAQPPSFDIFEEEKKSVKKRKVKDTHKKEKLVQNGKINGSVVHTTSPKKKVSTEEKTGKTVSEKQSPQEKKASKKTRIQNEKKILKLELEKLPVEDLGGGDWVKIVKKEKSKTKKKPTSVETTTAETVSSDANKSGDELQNDENKSEMVPKASETSPKKDVSPLMSDSTKTSVPEVHTEERVVDAKASPEGTSVPLGVQKAAAKGTSFAAITDENKLRVDSIVDAKSVEVSQEEYPVLQSGENVKPKKKKKKPKAEEKLAVEPNIEVEVKKLPEKDEVEALVPQGSLEVDERNLGVGSVETAETSVNTQVVNKDVNPIVEAKNSNVAFDEMAGLYPEPKEQKKKKKVRRDP